MISFNEFRLPIWVVVLVLVCVDLVGTFFLFGAVFVVLFGCSFGLGAVWYAWFGKWYAGFVVRSREKRIAKLRVELEKLESGKK